jgi:hypothetical protein
MKYSPPQIKHDITHKEYHFMKYLLQTSTYKYAYYTYTHKYA